MVFEFFANADKIKPPRRYQHRDEIYSLSARQTLSREFYRNTSGDVTVRPKTVYHLRSSHTSPEHLFPLAVIFVFYFYRKEDDYVVRKTE